jgi:Na+-driven multidrug efflux pump
MWAVGETDMEGLSIASTVSTVAFAIGSFCLGVAANIIVSYGGVEKLTEMGGFMLHECTWIMSAAALVFYLVGGYFLYRKGSLWKRIKSESRQIMLPRS